MQVRTRLVALPVAVAAMLGGGVAVASTAQAAPAAAAQESAVTAQELCCVPVWLPYGYFPTKRACEAEGRRLMKESIGVVAYQCRKQDNGEWKLYLLESA